MKRTVESKISFRVIGVLLIALTVAIVFFITDCPSNVQTYTIYILSSSGVCLLFPSSLDKTKLVYKTRDLTYSSVGAVAVIAGLIIYNPIDRRSPDYCRNASVTVYVHGKKGPQDIILRQGYVLMNWGGEPKKAPINEGGQAFFQNLQIGAKVYLNIEYSEPYKSVKPDSEYIISKTGAIYLLVELQGINKVEGRVLDGDSQLPNVNVQINGLNALTDSSGRFIIDIPEPQQQGSYEVWFRKKGFIGVHKGVHPQTGKPLEIILLRELVKHNN